MRLFTSCRNFSFDDKGPRKFYFADSFSVQRVQVLLISKQTFDQSEFILSEITLASQLICFVENCLWFCLHVLILDWTKTSDLISQTKEEKEVLKKPTHNKKLSEVANAQVIIGHKS